MTLEGRRTKRRLAHELFPHPDEGEVRSLAIDAPYELARAIGLDLDREWHELLDTRNRADTRAATERTSAFITAARLALLADALHRGLAGQEAWEAAMGPSGDTLDEWVWLRACEHGIPVDKIKPYNILDGAKSHDHWTKPEGTGWWTLAARLPIPEDDCMDCTEPIPDEETPA